MIQVLAGASELLARYRHAPPAAAALIAAAMDARRLGMGIGLPQAFTLVIETDRFLRRCHAVWNDAQRVGVVFD